jgi:hypothetical protein
MGITSSHHKNSVILKPWQLGCHGPKTGQSRIEEGGEGGRSNNQDKDVKVIVVTIGVTENVRKSVTSVLFLSDISDIRCVKELQKLIRPETTYCRSNSDVKYLISIQAYDHLELLYYESQRQDVAYVQTQLSCQLVKFTHNRSSSNDNDSDNTTTITTTIIIIIIIIQLQIILPVPQHTNSDTCVVCVYRKKSVMRDTTYMSGCFILTTH